MFKVNNKNTRTRSLTSFWCCYCWLLTYFTPFFSISIVDSEQVNFSWEKCVQNPSLFVIITIIISPPKLHLTCLPVFWIHWYSRSSGTCRNPFRKCTLHYLEDIIKLNWSNKVELYGTLPNWVKFQEFLSNVGTSNRGNGSLWKWLLINSLGIWLEIRNSSFLKAA